MQIHSPIWAFQASCPCPTASSGHASYPGQKKPAQHADAWLTRVWHCLQGVDGPHQRSAAVERPPAVGARHQPAAAGGLLQSALGPKREQEQGKLRDTALSAPPPPTRPPAHSSAAPEGTQAAAAHPRRRHSSQCTNDKGVRHGPPNVFHPSHFTLHPTATPTPAPPPAPTAQALRCRLWPPPGRQCSAAPAAPTGSP